MIIAVFAIVGLAHVIGTNGLTGTLDLFHDSTGAASATFAASRFAAGTLATLLVGALNDGTLGPSASSFCFALSWPCRPRFWPSSPL